MKPQIVEIFEQLILSNNREDREIAWSLVTLENKQFFPVHTIMKIVEGADIKLILLTKFIKILKGQGRMEEYRTYIRNKHKNR